MISLRSKITQKILSFFFLHEKEKFYINDLARILREDPSNVYKKLLEIRQEGIISNEFQGKERYFFLNKKFPLLKEYKKITLKKFGFEKLLKDKLKELKGEDIDSVYIFGSYAKNQLSTESDIDILVVGRIDTLKLQKKINEIQKITGREINAVEITKKEMRDRKKQGDPFLSEVFSGKFIKII